MKHLTEPEIKKLLAAVPNPRQRLMLLVAYLHGLRATELINLTADDIQYGRVRVNRLKGSDKTVQPFVAHPDPELDESIGLTNLANTLSGKERLFPMTRSGVLKLMKRAGKRARIDPIKLHPHALKHSCAMSLVPHIQLNELQKYLGHASLQSTGQYLKVSDETASRAAASGFSKGFAKGITQNVTA